MASRFRRTTFVRLAVGAAALAIPLFAAGSAVAAMGGAIPLTSTNRPDLRTVTLVSSSGVQFCFDKPLNQATALTGAEFVLGGYNPTSNTTQNNTRTPAAGAVKYDLTNANCVDAVYQTPAGDDLNQYTYGSVGADAVTGLNTANFNQADSTALTGSDTHNGTTGNTVAPDLVGVTTNPTFNTVSYVFNKNIGNVPAGSFFQIVDTGGNTCPSALAPTVSGNSVTVTFPANCPLPFQAGNSVNNAVRAVALAGAVQNATAGGEFNNDFEEAIVPGFSGTTAKPDLVSAMVEPSGGAVDYNFDQPIGAATASGFQIDLANNSIATGASATITNTPTTGTVRVTFLNGANFNEYDVKATVAPGDATALNGAPALTSTGGSVPVGDNAGAFARGFTSGPDAVQTTFNTGTGDVTVTFDQRVFVTDPPVPAGFVLLDQNGTAIVAGAGQTVTVVPAAAGPMQVVVHFGLSQPTMALAKALEICGPPTDVFTGVNIPAECTSAGATGGSVFTSSDATPFPDEPNVQQILSPFAVSSHLVKRVTVWNPARATKKHTKKHAKKHAKVSKHHRANKQR